MSEHAVIDRFEGETAVLLVGEESLQMDVPRSRLPAGAREGDWLKVEREGKRLLQAEIDPDETGRRKRRIAAKLERLRRGGHLKRKP